MPHVVRGLIRSPRFSLTVILTLGVGVGAGASIFALVDTLLLKPPAHVQDADRIKRLALLESGPSGSFTSTSLAWVDYEAMYQVESLEEVAAYSNWRRSLGRGTNARNVAVTLATPSYFPLLGVEPMAGRFFLPEDDFPDQNLVACIASHRFAERELDGPTSALGRTLLVGGLNCDVIGVAPPGFSGIDLSAIDLWLPIRASAHDAQGRDPRLWTTDRNHWVRVIGRFVPGTNPVVAADQATIAYRGFTNRTRDPELTDEAEWHSILPGRSTRRSTTSEISTLLLGGSLILLALIAVNLANLFIVRELGRARETAMRLALGGSPGRLFATSMAEASILALVAGGIGLLVAIWFGPIVRATLVTGLDFATGAVGLRVAAGTLGLALITTLAIGGASALRVRRADPAKLLAASGSPRAGINRRGRAIRLGLVGVQAALSAALLVTSLAFVNSFRRAAGTDIGFDRENVLAATAGFDGLELGRQEQWSFYRDALERVRTLPGVQTASLGYTTPWWNNRIERLAIPGRDSLAMVSRLGTPNFDAVTPDYLATLGLQMRRGRWIDDQDVAGAAPVMVINEGMQQLYWPGQDPMGECIYVGEQPTPCRAIVGVVADHRISGRLEGDPTPGYFLPLAQAADYNFTPRLFVRTATDAPQVIATVRQTVQTQRSDLPAVSITRLEDTFAPLVAPWRLGSYAFSAFGILATLVATLGLYSILSYVVAARRREFAIRAAVGGSSRQIALPVVRQGITTVAAGIGIGFLVAALSAARLQNMLYQTQLLEPWSLALVGSAALTLAAFACLAPARAAAGQDPVVALRED